MTTESTQIVSLINREDRWTALEAISHAIAGPVALSQGLVTFNVGAFGARTGVGIIDGKLEGWESGSGRSRGRRRRSEWVVRGVWFSRGRDYFAHGVDLSMMLLISSVCAKRTYLSCRLHAGTSSKTAYIGMFGLGAKTLGAGNTCSRTRCLEYNSSDGR